MCFACVVIHGGALREPTNLAVGVGGSNKRNDKKIAEKGDMEEEDAQSLPIILTAASAPKRLKRGTSPGNEAIFLEFIKLDEKLITSKGLSTSHWVCVCSFCKKHFDAALVKRPLIPLLPPKNITRTKRDCENHLKLCDHYKSQYNRTKRQ